MHREPRKFPPMPPVGQPDSYYGQLVRQADAAGDMLAHEAAKVGQYISLGMAENLDWSGKLRYFQHAIKRHCVPPPIMDDRMSMFYCNLADHIRKFAGYEALRLCSRQDDIYAGRVRNGTPKSLLRSEARTFFQQIVPGDKKPEWFLDEDWVQLKILRDQWI